MIILDTDHFNVLQIAKGAAYKSLAAHMDFEQVPNLRVEDWLS